MKLNSECIRDVMLELEKNLRVTEDDTGVVQMEYIDIDTLSEGFNQYSKSDIFYALFNLEQAGYVDLTILWADGGTMMRCNINYMTYAGHEFLERIRDSKRWSLVKKGLSAIRDCSISAISAVAEGVANAAISKFIEKIEL